MIAELGQLLGKSQRLWHSLLARLESCCPNARLALRQLRRRSKEGVAKKGQVQNCWQR